MLTALGKFEQSTTEQVPLVGTGDMCDFSREGGLERRDIPFKKETAIVPDYPFITFIISFSSRIVSSFSNQDGITFAIEFTVWTSSNLRYLQDRI